MRENWTYDVRMIEVLENPHLISHIFLISPCFRKSLISVCVTFHVTSTAWVVAAWPAEESEVAEEDLGETDEEH